jgi:hypothetical protein
MHAIPCGRGVFLQCSWILVVKCPQSGREIGTASLRQSVHQRSADRVIRQQRQLTYIVMPLFNNNYALSSSPSPSPLRCSFTLHKRVEITCAVSAPSAQILAAFAHLLRAHNVAPAGPALGRIADRVQSFDNRIGTIYTPIVLDGLSVRVCRGLGRSSLPRLRKTPRNRESTYGQPFAPTCARCTD